MKIVHVIPYMHAAAGGPPVVVDRLSRELAARGHDVRVLTTDLYAEGDQGWQTAGNFPFHLEIFPAARSNSFGYSRAFQRGIREAVHNCDIVHIHTLWTFASFAAARESLRANVPFLVMPHGMLDPHSVQRGWLKKQVYGRLVEWPLIRRASGMCYTHLEEERLAAETCRGLPRGHIVELGTESPPECERDELRAEFLDRYPELRGRKVVLFLGRLHSKKGLDLLIPAFDRVVQQQPEAHLLVVGPGESKYVESIRADVGRRGLDSKASFTGRLSGREKWAAMAASDLFVLPSYQENFALAAVDAMRGGLPVLLSRRVNLWQDVVEAGAGRDCEPTVDSVAQKLNDCLADEPWRTSAVEAGARILSTRFNWATTAARLEAIYGETVSGSAATETAKGIEIPQSDIEALSVAGRHKSQIDEVPNAPVNLRVASHQIHVGGFRVNHAPEHSRKHVSLADYSAAGYRPGRSALICLLWYFLSLLVLESGWFPVYRLKRWLLRLFGASIGRGVVIKPHVRIKYPWQLSIGDHSWIGEEAWIDNLAPVRIENDVCISQGVYLCTGSHDHERVTFDLIVKPIVIEAEAWVATRAVVLQGVTVGRGAVVAAGSVVTTDVSFAAIVGGIPAAAIGERALA
jgi:glycosyltransferase involved in cell wall biosynthesis/acetyltransferase-like isoleucine patch superfamily enzyme